MLGQWLPKAWATVAQCLGNGCQGLGNGCPMLGQWLPNADQPSQSFKSDPGVITGFGIGSRPVIGLAAARSHRRALSPTPVSSPDLEIGPALRCGEGAMGPKKVVASTLAGSVTMRVITTVPPSAVSVGLPRPRGRQSARRICREGSHHRWRAVSRCAASQ